MKRSDIRLWTAHYTQRSHRCDSKCGFGMAGVADATQWTSRSMGRTLDESLVADDFFGAKPRPEDAWKLPGPKPKPDWFWLWADWRRRGAPKPRPQGPPWLIPLWAWRALRKFNRLFPVK
jgi:hypothetical protein